jgi:hypothetical protein
MHSSPKRLYLVGALLAAVTLVAVVGTTVFRGNASQATESKSLDTRKSLDSQTLRSILTPTSAYPAGVSVQEITLEQAMADGMLQMPPDVVVAPAACNQTVSSVIGNKALATGWVHIGMAPPKTAAGQPGVFVRIVAQVPGGARLDKLREAAAACKSGTITLTKFGVVGTINLYEFAIPGKLGERSVGIRQIVTFPSDLSEEARQAAADGPLTTTGVYTSVGNVITVACEEEPLAAVKLGNELLDRATQALS